MDRRNRGARLLDDDRGGSTEELSEDLRDAWERLRVNIVHITHRDEVEPPSRKRSARQLLWRRARKRCTWDALV